MNAYYPLFITAHLLCAITFGGAVIFEVLILESLHKRFSHKTMGAIEAGIIERARLLMPWVVSTLFLSGLAMLHIRFPILSEMTTSSLGRLLLVKISIASIVLACFITALTLFAKGRMQPLLFKAIHLTVFCCVLAIIVLAKAMLYY